MQVDFYILNNPTPADSMRLACRLAEKAWGMGHKVYIRTPDGEASQKLDDLLWTFRQDSFVPHTLAETGANPLEETPILIGDAATPPAPLDVLINLADDVPSTYQQATRVAEIVGGDENARSAGRKRYRQYRDDGCELRSHDV